MKIKLAVLVGSLRNASYNMMLAQHIATQHEDQFEFHFLDLKLPLFNEDLNKVALHDRKLRRFYYDLDQADAILFISPEYNHSMSGVMKNAIDWGSVQPKGQKGLPKRIGLAMHCSSGLIGGARAHVHLRDSVNGIGMHMLPGNEVLISRAQDKFNEEGKLTDESTVKFIAGVMDRFVEYYNKLK